MTDVKGLIERLEALSGPAREVDRDIYFAFECEPIPEQGIVADWLRLGHRIMPGDGGAYYHRGTVPTDGSMADPYTASIDAALALTENLLPGWSWYVGSVGENDMPQATVTEPVAPCRDFVGHAPTASLAILIATLRALSPKEGC